MLGDLRYAIRTLLKNPRFTVMAVAILALGIGATSAMFSVVYSVLLHPLPYREPDRLMVVLGGVPNRTGQFPIPPADYADFRDRTRVFESTAAAELWGPTLTGVDRAEELSGLHVSSSLFRVLGVQAALGRTFVPDDDAAGRVVVLSHGLWKRRFGADAGIIGRSITLNGSAYTVIGVAPDGFYFPPFWANKAEIYATPAYDPKREANRTSSSLRMFARLKPGVSMDAARAEVETVAQQLAMEYPRSNAGKTARVTPLSEMSVGKIRPALLALFGAVAFTLLVACANLANLLLTRMAARQKEIAIRQSLGADRLRLIRQFLTESLVMALMGGLVGLLLTFWAVPALLAALPDSGVFRLPRSQEVGVGGAVIVFNFAVCLLTGILFGIAPALRTRKVDLNRDLKETGRGSTSARGGQRLRSALVVAEVALAMVLLAGAGLFIRTFQNLRVIDPGFRAEGALAVNLSLAGSGHARPELRSAFYRELLDRLQSMPGVESVSAVNHVPLAGDVWGMDFTVEGQPAPKPGNQPNAVYRVALPGYFRTMKIAMMAGRDFEERDRENAPRVAVINQTMARQFWPGQNAVGKRFHLGDAQSQSEWITIAGVIRDVKQSEWAGEPSNEFYVPYLQDADYLHAAESFRTMTPVVRYSGSSAAIVPLVKDQVWALDRNVAISSVLAMDQVVSDVLWQQRASMTLLGAFAGLALVLATVGIYAVMSYVVAGRTQEIGVRMALGARQRDVVWMVMKQSFAQVGGGIAIGLLGALGITRLLSTLLYGTAPNNPGVFGVVILLLALVGMAAAVIPARRAARIDPVFALRHE